MTAFTVITGASGAIGSAIALKLAKEGRPLFLHYHRSEDDVLRLQEKCACYDVPVFVVRADLSKKGGAQELYEQLHSPVDTLIYNCGVQQYRLFQDIQEEKLYEMAHLHLLNAMLLSQKLLPAMVSKKHGNIVVISSIWGERGAAMEVVYSALKGGVNTFVRALAKETAPSGIRVNGVAPGAMDTPMLHAFTDEEKQMLLEEIPSGRLGKAAEAADAVAFLTSEQASYINGHVLDINGGW
ncbi:3-oxoacyl-[acyl-carrier protein] reductase [Alteribacillus persepolensis]|uniref:3-oxoacyl-[acyl-carrier protein] reductase n=1 Tax=Alteribacillus persepolensis TaxID=568899 RepID=A0A1G7YVU2_9BACI|nr:SDR family oxidoreductase [Alteribacillus persepolensis]SDG99950.1 3-oxoacyl-[acyl-carrier protein] reductase [Alteribacillus persepolensis]